MTTAPFEMRSVLPSTQRADDPQAKLARLLVVESLRSGGREGAVTASRIRAALMMAQAMLSVVLIVGAGLFVQSLRRAAAVTLGFRPRSVLVALMDVIPLGCKLPQRLALYGNLRERIAALPGVAGAAVSTTYPMQGYRYGIRVRVPGRDSLPPSPDDLLPGYNAVTGGYFSALGIPIVDGRPITEADIGAASQVAVLDNAMARAYWPGERAVGRCIMINADSACTTVVGVAADAKEAIDRDDRRFLVYVPMGYAWGPGRTCSWSERGTAMPGGSSSRSGARCRGRRRIFPMPTCRRSTR